MCLATFKIKHKINFLASHFYTPLNANAREEYPFVVRYYWQQKLKARCASSSSSHSFVVLFNPPREGERKREKERESDRRLCSLFFVLRSTTILSFPRKSFLLSLLLCLLLSKRAQTERDKRERERESSIADMNDLLVTNEQVALWRENANVFLLKFAHTRVSLLSSISIN